MNFKQPLEVITLALPFGVALVAPATVSVVGRGQVVGSTVPTILANRVVGSSIEVDLSGGTDGERYLITARCGTAVGGDTLERETELAVIDFRWQVPDGATAYLTPAQLVTRVGLDLAIRLTDADGIGRLDVGRLTAAITDAGAEADGYLAGRYQTPLSAPSALLTATVFDLALARLWQGQVDAPDGVVKAQAAARALLRDIAKGVMTLPGAANQTPADGAAAPVLFQPGAAPLFSRDKLTGF